MMPTEAFYSQTWQQYLTLRSFSQFNEYTTTDKRSKVPIMTRERKRMSCGQLALHDMPHAAA